MSGFVGPRERAPRILLDIPVVEGALSVEVVRRVAQRNRDTLRACYEQRLRGEPDLAASVTLRHLVSAGGDVMSAEAGGLPSVGPCFVAAARAWRFPAPDRGTARVTATYRLSTM